MELARGAYLVKDKVNMTLFLSYYLLYTPHGRHVQYNRRTVYNFLLAFEPTGEKNRKIFLC